MSLQVFLISSAPSVTLTGNYSQKSDGEPLSSVERKSESKLECESMTSMAFPRLTRLLDS